jgi:hypothetical protein
VTEPTQTVVAPDPAELDASAKAANNLTDGLGLLGVGAKKATDEVQSLMNSVKSITDTITQTGVATDIQAVQFAGLAKAVVGTISAYNDFAGAIDRNNVSLFTDQIQDLKNALGKDGATSKLIEFANTMGAAVPKSIQGSAKAVEEYVTGIFAAADNTLKFQNAMIQLSAQTGQLTELYGKARDDLGSLNKVTTQQMALVSSVADANNISTNVATKYYSELMKIPGAVNNMVQPVKGMRTEMSLFDASIKLAVGTGQSFSSVVKEMSNAIKIYGANGSEALNFVSRISEVSNAVGGDLEQVSAALNTTAAQFKFIGNNTDGAASALLNYTKVLKESGLATAPAIELAQKMINKVSDLSLAQKAFLSQQTGGGGGLLGGLKIEKALAEGKFSEVLEKVRESIQKQTGNITTRDSVKTESQAANYVRQREIVKSQLGLSGASGDAEANKFLDAFKKRQTGEFKTQDLDNLQLGKQIDVGTKIQEKTYTEISKLRSSAEKIQAAVSGGALTYAQSAFTLGHDKTQAGDDIDGQDEYRKSLGESRDRARLSTNDVLKATKDPKSAGHGGEGLLIKSGMETMGSVLSGLPTAIQQGMRAAKRLSGLGDEDAAKKVVDNLVAKTNQDVNKARAERDKAKKDPKHDDAMLKTLENRVAEAQRNALQFSALSNKFSGKLAGQEMPGQREQAQSTSQERGQAQEVHVVVEGLCIDCGNKMKATAHKTAITSTTR